MNQWIASAVARRAGGLETAADFFKNRAGNNRAGLMKLLRTAPEDAPEPEDER